MNHEVLLQIQNRLDTTEKGRAFNHELTKAVFRKFLINPDEVEETEAWAKRELHKKFKPTRKHSTEEETLRSILLAACQGVTELFIGIEAVKKYVNEERKEPEYGPPGCYVVKSWTREADLVKEYEIDSPEDRFMRAAVPMLVAVGERIGEQSKDPSSPYHQYRPIWDKETELRKELSAKKDDVKKSDFPSQIPEDLENFDSFDPERLRQNNAQFINNVLKNLIILKEAAIETYPDIWLELIQEQIILNVETAETAAMYSHLHQRAAMDIEQERLYNNKRRIIFRRAFKQYPHMYLRPSKNYHTGHEFVIYALADEPRNPSMCVGAMPQSIPRLDVQQENSPIYYHTTFSAYAVAPWTILKDLPKRDAKMATPH